MNSNHARLSVRDRYKHLQKENGPLKGTKSTSGLAYWRRKPLESEISVALDKSTRAFVKALDKNEAVSHQLL